MFVDLVGSIALSARLDPEDMRELIRGYVFVDVDTLIEDCIREVEKSRAP